VYNKGGIRVDRGSTDLPGGNANSADGWTMLDCISVKSVKRKFHFYILDILHWKDTPLSNAEFDCRRFFLQSKLDEMPQLAEGERFSFRSLPSCLCTVEAMTELMKTDFGFKLDGLLFYYSKVFYTPGQTPLVGWLKPWMLPEILGVEINDTYAADQGFFATSQQFIEKYNEKHHFKSSIKPQSTSEGN